MCLLSRRISNKVKLLTWIINKTGIYFTGRYFPRITVSRTVSSRRVRFAVGWGRRQTNGDDIEIRPLKTKYLHLRGSFSVLSSTETCLSLNCDSQICQPHPSSRSHLSPPIPQTHPRARDAETSRARVAAMVNLLCWSALSATAGEQTKERFRFLACSPLYYNNSPTTRFYCIGFWVPT